MTITKNQNAILAFALFISLIVCKLSDSHCYTYAVQRNQKTILNQQKVYGFDCFTGRFKPPVKLDPVKSDYFADKYGLFSFNRFRVFYLVLVATVFLTLVFLRLKKAIFAAISSTLAVFAAIVCLIYFDGFHNYYFDSAGEKFDVSLTIDIDFGWLSSLFFWVMLIALFILNWVSVMKRGQKNQNIHLLDN